MSIKMIETLEFECDGQCGVKKIVTSPTRSRRVPPTGGWMIVVGHPDDVDRHFCPTCWSLMTSLLYNHPRQLAYLKTLSGVELDDFDLEDRLERLVVEDQRLRKAT